MRGQVGDLRILRFYRRGLRRVEVRAADDGRQTPIARKCSSHDPLGGFGGMDAIGNEQCGERRVLLHRGLRQVGDCLVEVAESVVGRGGQLFHESSVAADDFVVMRELGAMREFVVGRWRDEGDSDFGKIGLDGRKEFAVSGFVDVEIL